MGPHLRLLHDCGEPSRKSRRSVASGTRNWCSNHRGGVGRVGRRPVRALPLVEQPLPIVLVELALPGVEAVVVHADPLDVLPTAESCASRVCRFPLRQWAWLHESDERSFRWGFNESMNSGPRSTCTNRCRNLGRVKSSAVGWSWAALQRPRLVDALADRTFALVVRLPDHVRVLGELCLQLVVGDLRGGAEDDLPDVVEQLFRLVHRFRSRAEVCERVAARVEVSISMTFATPACGPPPVGVGPVHGARQPHDAVQVERDLVATEVGDHALVRGLQLCGATVYLHWRVDLPERLIAAAREHDD